MYQWISKCVVIAALFLSANMLALSTAELLDADSEIAAVGGIPNLVKKDKACMKSADCVLCQQFAECTSEDLYVGEVYIMTACSCSGGNDGCDATGHDKVCVATCGGGLNLCCPHGVPWCGAKAVRQSKVVTIGAMRECVPVECKVNDGDWCLGCIEVGDSLCDGSYE